MVLPSKNFISGAVSSIPKHIAEKQAIKKDLQLVPYPEGSSDKRKPAFKLVTTKDFVSQKMWSIKPDRGPKVSL